MSDEPKKRRSRWWVRAWIWWAIPAMLVLYPLSAGPAFWTAQHLQDHGWDDPGHGWFVYSAVYDPLYIEISRVPSLDDAFRRYVRFFDADPR